MKIEKHLIQKVDSRIEQIAKKIERLRLRCECGDEVLKRRHAARLVCTEMQIGDE